MPIDLPSALRAATIAAQHAGEIIRGGYDEVLSVTVKGDPADRVTQFDHQAQSAIASLLQQAHPHIPMMGEEDTEAFNDADVYWVVDPLDGTSNFIQRLPHVGVSIGLRVHGQSVLGVLHFPILGTTYTAIAGQGAHRNGVPIQVQQRESLAAATVAEIFSDRQCRGKDVGYPPALMFRKFGSAVTSLAYLAQGSIHAMALECYLWDIAAGEVIIREAGGRVEWSFLHPEDGLRSPVQFFAATPGIFEEFASVAHREFSRWNAH
jgi:myo-inositol-1(or 4)-monophosphatase